MPHTIGYGNGSLSLCHSYRWCVFGLLSPPCPLKLGGCFVVLTLCVLQRTRCPKASHSRNSVVCFWRVSSRVPIIHRTGRCMLVENSRLAHVIWSVPLCSLGQAIIRIACPRMARNGRILPLCRAPTYTVRGRAIIAAALKGWGNSHRASLVLV